MFQVLQRLADDSYISLILSGVNLKGVKAAVPYVGLLPLC